VLDLNGRKEADDVAALLEDREGARALMRVTRGDPEDVTKERLPYILEQVKLAAGEFAAGVVRAESEKALEAARTAHAEEIEKVRHGTQAIQDAKEAEVQAARLKLVQAEQDRQTQAGQNAALQQSLAATARAETTRLEGVLDAAFLAGAALYSTLRWSLAVGFGLLSGLTAWLSSYQPTLAIGASFLLGAVGFWFVPEFLERPLHAAAMRRLRAVVAMKDASALIPLARPDFRQPSWNFKLDASEQIPPLPDRSERL
jgi:hypothetical protein